MSQVFRVIWGALLFGAWLGAYSTAAERPDPQSLSGKIQWVFDYQEGQRLSRETGRPMFVVFRCER